MNKILVAIAVLAVSAVGAEANAAVTFKFSNPSGNLGVSHTYTVSGLSIIAKGFDQNNNPTALWGKNGGGNEDGLGLANDDTGDHEIEYLKGFVQLDVSGLFNKVVAGSTKFATNSTNGTASMRVFMRIHVRVAVTGSRLRSPVDAGRILIGAAGCLAPIAKPAS